MLYTVYYFSLLDENFALLFLKPTRIPFCVILYSVQTCGYLTAISIQEYLVGTWNQFTSSKPIRLFVLLLNGSTSSFGLERPKRPVLLN
jgi:hypothetical protein